MIYEKASIFGLPLHEVHILGRTPFSRRLKPSEPPSKPVAPGAIDPNDIVLYEQHHESNRWVSWAIWQLLHVDSDNQVTVTTAGSGIVSKSETYSEEGINAKSISYRSGPFGLLRRAITYERD